VAPTARFGSFLTIVGRFPKIPGERFARRRINRIGLKFYVVFSETPKAVGNTKRMNHKPVSASIFTRPSWSRSGFESPRRWIAVILASMVLASVSVQTSGQIRDEEAEGREPEKAWFYDLDGIVDATTATRFRENVETQLTKHPDIRTLILRIDSPGTPKGDLEPAISIAKTLHSQKGVTSVAYIVENGQSCNAASLIAIACDRLVMGSGAVLGFRADRETEILDRNKHDAMKARAEMAFYVRQRRRAYPSELALAFVSRFHQDVFEVQFTEFGRGPNRNETVKTEVLSAEQIELLPQAKRVRMRPGTKKEIVRSEDRLTLTSAEAKKYRVARDLVRDDADALRVLGVRVADEDILVNKRGTLKPQSQAGQSTVDFLNHFLVRFILLALALTGVLLEFKMPGTFVPVSIGTVCFVIFFVGAFFPVTGAAEPTASVFELVLFCGGVSLIAMELFVIPGIMIFAILGFGVAIVGMVLAMVPPASASSLGPDIGDAIKTLSLATLTGFGIFFLLLRFLPKTSYFGHRGLVHHEFIKGTPTADSALESQAAIAGLVGKRGIALTPLNPAGKVDVEGDILDVVAESEYVDKGEPIRIVEATAMRAVVRAEKPEAV